MGKNKKDKPKAHKGTNVAKASTDHSRRRLVADPSAALRKIYDSRQNLSTGEVLEQLESTATNLGEVGWMHPVDVEVFWLILGDLCTKDYIADEHLRMICQLMERYKMYQQVCNCVR